MPAVRTRALLAAAGCSLIGLLLGLAVSAQLGWLLRCDAAVSTALYAGDDRPLPVEVLLQVVTAPGLAAVRAAVYLPVVVWLVRRRAGVTAVWVVCAVVLLGPVDDGLKSLVGRVRPQFAGGGAGYDTLSFPSGHSAGVATLVTVALVLGWPLLGRPARSWWLAGGVLLALVVAASRLVLGAHWLSDVVAGLALGVAWTLVTAAAFDVLPGGRFALRRPQVLCC